MARPRVPPARPTRRALALLVAAWPATADAQPRRAHPARIAVLEWEGPEATNHLAALRQALAELGLREGSTLQLDDHYALGRVDRAEALAQEIVRASPDAILAFSTPTAGALRRATDRIPILVSSADPVGTGLVPNLAHPGGNLTGVSLMLPELEPKRLGLLREALPHATRIAYLAVPGDPASAAFLAQAGLGAARLGLRLEAVFAETAERSEAALAAARAAGAEALLLQPIFTGSAASARRMGEAAAQLGLPAMGSFPGFAEGGGLMAYGPPADFGYRRLAQLAARILSGARPGEIPVEQPVEFEFVVNLAAARRLRLALSSVVLARADRVIE